MVSNVEKDGKPVGIKRAGWGWHSDGEDNEIPNLASMLYGVKPPTVGGDTGFASTYRAYEALAPETQSLLDEKRARFSQVDMHLINYPNLPPQTEAERPGRPDVWYPMIRTTLKYCESICASGAGRWRSKESLVRKGAPS